MTPWSARRRCVRFGALAYLAIVLTTVAALLLLGTDLRVSVRSAPATATAHTPSSTLVAGHAFRSGDRSGRHTASPRSATKHPDVVPAPAASWGFDRPRQQPRVPLVAVPDAAAGPPYFARGP